MRLERGSALPSVEADDHFKGRVSIRGVSVNKIAGYPTFRRRLLANMPEDVANSFTELQLTMIEHALDGGHWREHRVDVRLSIPFLWRRFYFVLLAGPERRSRERRTSERLRRPLATIANVVFFALFLLLLIPAAVGSIQLISMDWVGR